MCHFNSNVQNTNCIQNALKAICTKICIKVNDEEQDRDTDKERERNRIGKWNWWKATKLYAINYNGNDKKQRQHIAHQGEDEELQMKPEGGNGKRSATSMEIEGWLPRRRLQLRQIACCIENARMCLRKHTNWNVTVEQNNWLNTLQIIVNLTNLS